MVIELGQERGLFAVMTSFAHAFPGQFDVAPPSPAFGLTEEVDA